MNGSDNNSVPLFMEEFFNVKVFCKSTTQSTSSIARIANSLTEVVNGKNARLPKHLIVIIEKDVIGDINDVLAFDAHKALNSLTNWVVRQMNTIVRCKRLDLWEKKPGSLSGYSTNIIFVKMIQRVGNFNPELRMYGVCALRPQFNDALNDAVAKK